MISNTHYRSVALVDGLRFPLGKRRGQQAAALITGVALTVFLSRAPVVVPAAVDLFKEETIP